jgi:hypothetical protein
LKGLNGNHNLATWNESGFAKNYVLQRHPESGRDGVRQRPVVLVQISTGWYARRSGRGDNGAQVHSQTGSLTLGNSSLFGEDEGAAD